MNAGYGVQPQWKAVTQIDAAQQFPGVSEGNTNSNGQFTSLNFSAPYVTLGTDDFVTYESISASEGYEDALGDGKMWQLLRFIRQQERSYLGGAGTTASNGALQIGTTNTPTAALSTLNTRPANQAILPTGSYAAAYAVALNYRAAINPNNTVVGRHHDAVSALERGRFSRRHQRRHGDCVSGLECGRTRPCREPRP